MTSSAPVLTLTTQRGALNAPTTTKRLRGG
jgi:hypothetical protein